MRLMLTGCRYLLFNNSPQLLRTLPTSLDLEGLHLIGGEGPQQIYVGVFFAKLFVCELFIGVPNCGPSGPSSLKGHFFGGSLRFFHSWRPHIQNRLLAPETYLTLGSWGTHRVIQNGTFTLFVDLPRHHSLHAPKGKDVYFRSEVAVAFRIFRIFAGVRRCGGYLPRSLI